MADLLANPLPVSGLESATDRQCRALLTAVERFNMVLFSLGEMPSRSTSDSIRHFMARLGFKSLDANLCSNEDAVSKISVNTDEKIKEGYIPYTNKPLSWHTDGYYNVWHQRVRSFLLICEAAAESGGENELFDPDIALLKLHDEDPAFVQALMHPDAMCIPENRQKGELLRPQTCTPVFELTENSEINMRYSARQKNILWRETPETQEAVACLNELLQTPSVYLLRHRLQPWQGYLSNNVLHRRLAFKDGARQRVLYRARFYERVPKPMKR